MLDIESDLEFIQNSAFDKINRINRRRQVILSIDQSCRKNFLLRNMSDDPQQRQNLVLQIGNRQSEWNKGME